MVLSKVGPNQSIEWGQIRVSKSAFASASKLSGMEHSVRPLSLHLIAALSRNSVLDWVLRAHMRRKLPVALPFVLLFHFT
jgi:hypothetical protein